MKFSEVFNDISLLNHMLSEIIKLLNNFSILPDTHFTCGVFYAQCLKRLSYDTKNLLCKGLSNKLYHIPKTVFNKYRNSYKFFHASRLYVK